jgi:hypothetical protein
MTAPARIPTSTPEREQLSALDRARRSLPLIARQTSTDEETVDVRAFARQLVATALEIEGVETSSGAADD